MTHDKQEELKPCPFCDLPLMTIYLSDSSGDVPDGYIHPNTDCALGDVEFGLDDVTAWNTRPREQALEERVKELEALAYETSCMIESYAEDCNVDILDWMGALTADLKGEPQDE